MVTHLPSIPKLEDYDMSSRTGFLPCQPPLTRLKDNYYEPWESIMQDLKELLLAGKFRSRCNEMPILDTKYLRTLKEYQRAFVILTFFAHSYVWGKNEPVSQELVAPIAVPLVKVSEYLGINPVSCNASVVVWNWKLLDNDETISLDNLASLHTFTGSSDEAWFYLITVAIEALGGPALDSILTAIQAVRENNDLQVVESLDLLSQTIGKINVVLKRMYEKCDPYLFYWKIRPYLAGWENMAEAGLPLGVQYQGIDDNGSDGFKRYAGGSAAQSALIQAFDIALDIQHYPTAPEWKAQLEATLQRAKAGLPKEKSSRGTYLYSMRAHMPGLHRQFLEDLTQVANIRSYCKEGLLKEAYNNCVDGLKSFRDLHIQIVTKYIVIPGTKKGSLVAFPPASAGPIEQISIKEPETFSLPKRADSLKVESSGFSKLSESFKFVTIPENGTLPPTDLPPLPVTPPMPVPQRSFSTPISTGISPRLKATMGSPQRDVLYPQLNHPPTQTQSNVQIHGIAQERNSDTGVVRGTGGTDLMPFLKQVRDETTATKL